MVSHPCRPARARSPRQGWSGRSVLPRVLSVFLSENLERARKMLRTDFCNRLTTRAPVDRSIPRRVAFASPTALPPALSSPRAPRRQTVVAADPAPGKRASDVAREASTGSLTASSPRWGLAPSAALQRFSAAALSTAREAGDRPLTLPVAPRRLPRISPKRLTRNQSRFHHLLVKEDGFPDPERLPSTSAPQGRLRVPVSQNELGARHRSLGFAAAIRLPALFRSSDALARRG
jgi:hypothetical protein